jgi:hypothetical protein
MEVDRIARARGLVRSSAIVIRLASIAFDDLGGFTSDLATGIQIVAFVHSSIMCLASI